MNPENTPKLIQSHGNAISSIEQVVILEKENREAAAKLVELFGNFLPDDDYQKVNISKLKDKDDIPGRFVGHINDDVFYSGASAALCKVSNPYDRHKTELGAEIVTDILAFPMIDGTRATDIKETGKKMLFFRLRDASNRSDDVTTVDRLGENIKYGVLVDADSNVQYYKIVDSTESGRVTQELRRPDVAEASGESVEARVVKIESGVYNYKIVEMDSNDPEDIERIEELKDEVKRAAESLSRT